MRSLAEAERRQRTKLKTDRLTRFRDDPIGFVELALLNTLWSKQRQILEALKVHRLVAVQSCHDVGKSRVAALAGAWWLSAHDPGEAFLVTLAPTGHQVKAILWREIKRIHAAGKLPGYITQTEWKTDIGELIGMGRSPKDTDGTALQGIHDAKVLLIFDEACGVVKTLWDAGSSLVANEDSRWLAIGNPDDPSSEFAEVCKPGSGWHVITISAFDSPNFTNEPVPDFLRKLLISKTWVAERERKWGKTSPQYTSKVKGEFPSESADGLIPLGTIAPALARSELEPNEPVELGVDVARFGSNYTVIYLRRGHVAKKLFKVNGNDTMMVTGHIVRAIETWHPTAVKIDDIGVGGGVTDRLREIKLEPDSPIPSFCQIVPINVGERSTFKQRKKDDPKNKAIPQTERYLNLRAELNWAMRERFQAGDISIELDWEGRRDEDLEFQAGQMKYFLTSRGEIQIESKEDMEERLNKSGLASPDDWDALVLAFAPGKIGAMPRITPEMLAMAAQRGRSR
jgi:hypothetical protein